MPSSIIFISFYTRKSPYEKVMNTHLRPSLEKFNLIHDIEEVEDRGNWQKNTSYKSEFILKMLLKHKKNIVFIDADGTIEKHPSLFWEIPEEYDIAYHLLDWMRQWRNKEGGDKWELLSGTMMFRYNEKVLSLVRKWVERTKTSTKWEQRILQEIIKNNKEIKSYILPAEYTTVAMHDGSIPKYIKKPVIFHHQKSRQYRNRRNWKR